MTPQERDRVFRRARLEAAKVLPDIQRSTAARIAGLLEEAAERIAGDLAGQPSEFEAWRLPQLQAAVRGALSAFADEAAGRIDSAAGEAWSAGVTAVDRPIAIAGQIALDAALVPPDIRQLAAMRNFMTDRIRAASADAIGRINADLGLAAIGAQSTNETVGRIRQHLGGASRRRANTILRTELGRIYAAAANERIGQAQEMLPGMRKQWRRSGKIRSRIDHDLADGQIVDADEVFRVGGERLRYPRDPRGSARNTINCGCTLLPFMEEWAVAEAGARPYTIQELALDPRKRALERAVPAGEVIRIDAYDGMPEAAARRRIAEVVESEEFARLVRGGPDLPGRQPVARIGEDLAGRLSLPRARVLQLSSDSAAKQRARHPELTAADYRAVQGVLDHGRLIPAGHSTAMMVNQDDRGQWWRAVLRTSSDRREAFLVSFHKVRPAEAGRLIRNLER